MRLRTLGTLLVAAITTLPMLAQATGPYALRNRWLAGALSRGRSRWPSCRTTW